MTILRRGWIEDTGDGSFGTERLGNRCRKTPASHQKGEKTGQGLTEKILRTSGSSNRLNLV
jgi:hypothetical protein